jgi:hypothetical protein
MPSDTHGILSPRQKSSNNFIKIYRFDKNQRQASRAGTLTPGLPVKPMHKKVKPSRVMR